MNHVYGWLLLLPAAVFLTAFTYYPMVSTFFVSFFSDGTATRPSVFVGLENYQFLLEDEIFWKVLVNNLWYAVGTIPTSIGIALLMAIWVNNRLRPGAHGLFYPDSVTDDCCCQYLAVFLHTPDRPV